MKYFPQAIRFCAVGLGALAFQSCEYSDNPYGHSSHGGYNGPGYTSGVVVAPAPYYGGGGYYDGGGGGYYGSGGYDRRYDNNRDYDHNGNDPRYHNDDRYRNDDRNSQYRNGQNDHHHNNQSSQPQTVTKSNSHQKPATRPPAKPAPKQNKPASKDQKKGSGQIREQ